MPPQDYQYICETCKKEFTVNENDNWVECPNCGDYLRPNYQEER